MRISIVTFFALSLSVLGCNSFDPDLGATPFKCGPVEPRCPESFTCQQSGTAELCVADGQDPSTFPDGGGIPGEFSCNNDSEVEPNDTTTTAVNTALDGQAAAPENYRLVGLLICPTTDQDNFWLRTKPGANSTINASIEVGNGTGGLVLEILSAGGAPLTTGTPSVADPSVIEATISQANASGEFYVRVSSDGSGENNYNVNITVTQ